MESFLNGRVILHAGDCLDVLATLAENSVDSVVCDPPYHLTSIVKRFGSENSAPAKGNEAFMRASRGFMGKQWDGGDIAFKPGTWRAVMRVLKPGGHLVAFSGTRTYHRMAVAIEDAGFEIRDCLQYLYGSGFPKSHSVTKGAGDAICSCEAIPERDLRSVRRADVSSALDAADQRGEILLPQLPEQSPSSAVLWPESEEGRSRVTKLGVEGRGDVSQEARELRQREIRPLPAGVSEHGESGRLCNGTPTGNGADRGSSFVADGMRPPHRSSAIEQPSIELGTVALQPQPQERGAWPHCDRCGKPILPDGFGTALKPAVEPICLARKPLSEKTVAANVLKWSVGALNIDGCRVATDGETFTAPQSNPENRTGVVGIAMQATGGANRNHAAQRASIERTAILGRWPANLLHDGSEEVLAGFPETSDSVPGVRRNSYKNGNSLHDGVAKDVFVGHADSGSAARFFYTAKADSDDRIGSKHPTVKPVDLMCWLVRLVTPKGGTCLDPFAGTGTTGEAAFREGCKAILIEREEEYQADIRRRMALCLAGPEEKQRAIIKAKGLTMSAGPLFA